MAEQEKWLSLAEIAKYINASRDTLYRWVAEDKIPAHKVGRCWKFKVSEIDEWIKQK